MKKLLLATNNPGKLSEMKKGLISLSSVGWQLFSLKEIGITHEPEEIGATFQENALLKARYYAEYGQMPVIADDGGFVIPALNNEPGVKSHRWLGREATDEELIQYTLSKVSPLKPEERTAYLELVLCFHNPQDSVTYFENEKISGQIASAPTQKRVQGFPYRALLKVEPFNKFYDELSEEEHLAVNHRLRALGKLIPKLKEAYER